MNNYLQHGLPGLLLLLALGLPLGQGPLPAHPLQHCHCLLDALRLGLIALLFTGSSLSSMSLQAVYLMP